MKPSTRRDLKAKQPNQYWQVAAVISLLLLAQVVLCSDIFAQDAPSAEEMSEMFKFAGLGFVPKHHHGDKRVKFHGTLEEWLPTGHLTWEEAMNFKHMAPEKFQYFVELTQKHLLTVKPILVNPKFATFNLTSSGTGENQHDFWRTTLTKKGGESVLIKYPMSKDISHIYRSHTAFWARSDSKRIITIKMVPDAQPTKPIWQAVAELNPIWNYYAGVFKVAQESSGPYTFIVDMGKGPGNVDLRTNIALANFQATKKNISTKPRADIIDKLFIEYRKWQSHLANLVDPLNAIEVSPPTAVTAHKYVEQETLIESSDGFKERDLPTVAFDLEKDKIPERKIELAIKVPRKLPPQTPMHLYFEFFCFKPGSKPSSMNIALEEDGKLVWQTSERLIPTSWQPYGYSFETSGQQNSKRVLKIHVDDNAFPIRLANLSLYVDTGEAAQRANIISSEVKKRIENRRCGSMSILVKDKSGNPIKNAKVKVEQQSHEFHFGCQSGGLNPNDQSAAQKSYQKQLCDLFNCTTTPAYWDEIEAVQGKPVYGDLEAKARWCADHHIYLLITDLLSPNHYPSWGSSKPEEEGAQIKKHILDTIGHFGTRIPAWEVVHNLTEISEDNSKEGKSKNSHFLENWMNSLPKANNDHAVIVLERLLTWGRKAASNQPLDFYYREDNLDRLPNIIAGKKQFGLVPNQVEIKLTSAQENKDDLVETWEVLNSVSKYPLPLAITNIAVKNGADSDELNQAKRAEELYRLLFSYPNVSSIYWKDLKDDPREPKHGSGLVRSNGTTKPAYDRLLKLIHKEWWTNLEGTTDSKGLYNPKPFFGEHLITVSDGKGHTVRQAVHYTNKNKDVPIEIAL